MLLSEYNALSKESIVNLQTDLYNASIRVGNSFFSHACNPVCKLDASEAEDHLIALTEKDFAIVSLLQHDCLLVYLRVYYY